MRHVERCAYKMRVQFTECELYAQNARTIHSARTMCVQFVRTILMHPIERMTMTWHERKRDQLGRRDQFGANRDVLRIQHRSRPLGMLVRFMPIILGIWCDGSNKSRLSCRRIWQKWRSSRSPGNRIIDICRNVHTTRS